MSFGQFRGRCGHADRRFRFVNFDVRHFGKSHKRRGFRDRCCLCGGCGFRDRHRFCGRRGFHGRRRLFGENRCDVQFVVLFLPFCVGPVIQFGQIDPHDEFAVIHSVQYKTEMLWGLFVRVHDAVQRSYIIGQIPGELVDDIVLNNFPPLFDEFEHFFVIGCAGQRRRLLPIPSNEF